MFAKLSRLVPVLSLLFVLAFGNVAEAGCFREFRQCADCAKQRANKAWAERDLNEYFDAVADAMDCQVDLYHCIFLGKHHTYGPCAL